MKLSKLHNKLIKYLVAAILLVIPLYPKFPLIRIPNTYVAIRLEDILMIVVFVSVMPLVYKQRYKLAKNPILIAILLFLLTGALSLISALLITKTVEPLIGLLHWIRRVEYIAPVFLGYYAVKLDKSNLLFYFKIILLTLFLVFLYGFGQKYFEWPIIITQNREFAKGIALRSIPGGHLNSTFAGHYDLATYVILMLPFLITLLFTRSVEKYKKFKLLIVIVLAQGIWLIGISGSRISTMSLLVSASLALVFIKKFKYIPIVIVFSVIIFSFSSNLVSRYQDLINVAEIRARQVKEVFIKGSVIVDSVYASNDELVLPEKRREIVPTLIPPPILEDRSTSIRLNVEWPRAIRALKKNPLIGTGYSSITLATDNDYLRALGEMGLIGFISFFLIFAQLGKTLAKSFPFVRNYKSYELTFVAGFTAALPGIFLNAVFIDVFEASKFAIIFWLMMGIMLGTISESNE